jgi:hypothetical protein
MMSQYQLYVPLKELLFLSLLFHLSKFYCSQPCIFCLLVCFLSFSFGSFFPVLGIESIAYTCLESILSLNYIPTLLCDFLY